MATAPYSFSPWAAGTASLTYAGAGDVAEMGLSTPSEPSNLVFLGGGDMSVKGLTGRYGSLANSSILREARLAHLHLAVGVVQVVALGWCPSAVSWGEETAWETWGVWSGLHLELREVEVGAGTIAGGHGLSEAALGVVAVEGYAVDDDGDDFDYYFDDAADE